MSIKSEKLTVSDENGNSATFTVDRKDKQMMFTIKDVGNILDALLAVITDALRHGEKVSMWGFGSFEIRKTKEHRVREPDAEIWHTIPSQYRPKFTSGFNLSAAVRSYGLQEDDTGADEFLPPPVDEDEEEP